VAQEGSPIPTLSTSSLKYDTHQEPESVFFPGDVFAGKAIQLFHKNPTFAFLLHFHEG